MCCFLWSTEPIKRTRTGEAPDTDRKKWQLSPVWILTSAGVCVCVFVYVTMSVYQLIFIFLSCKATTTKSLFLVTGQQTNKKCRVGRHFVLFCFFVPVPLVLCTRPHFFWEVKKFKVG